MSSTFEGDQFGDEDVDFGEGKANFGEPDDELELGGIGDEPGAYGDDDEDGEDFPQ